MTMPYLGPMALSFSGWGQTTRFEETKAPEAEEQMKRYRRAPRSTAAGCERNGTF